MNDNGDHGDCDCDGDGDDNRDSPEGLAGVRVVAHAAPELPLPYSCSVPNQLQ